MNSTYDKKKVLVTGGAGFLGSHLCEQLLERGDHVICLDDLSSGFKENISIFETNNNFEFIEQDVISPINLSVDEIYNLACPASPKYYQKNPIKTLKTSFYGAENLLCLAEQNKAKILQASTSEIYGDPLEHPQTESYWGNVNPIGIRSCYDEGKRVAEALFFDYHRQRNINIRVVRIFNTYGPKMHPSDGRVVSNFIIQALKNENITIYGDGMQTRSFCFVDDLIEGLIKVMNTEIDDPVPINLGNPEEYKILQLADLVIELTNSSSKIEHKPLPPDDPVFRRPSIDMAIEKIDWHPLVQLTEGLKETIAYFNKVLN
jgi:UDP-glucuronate decarboxylase